MKEEKSFRVYKSFYFSTLAVSQKMVYNVYQKKDQATEIVKSNGRDRHESHHREKGCLRAYQVLPGCRIALLPWKNE